MAKQITPNQAKALCNNYDQKYAEISKFIGKQDNRSVYIPLDDLKNYLNYIENAKQGIDGIRIYLGSYGKDQDKQEGYTTVFIAPTCKEEDNTVLDLLNYGDKGFPPQNKYGE